MLFQCIIWNGFSFQGRVSFVGENSCFFSLPLDKCNSFFHNMKYIKGLIFPTARIIGIAVTYHTLYVSKGYMVLKLFHFNLFEM